MSRRIFAANWKMHHGPQAARAFLDRFLPRVTPEPERELWFFPPAASIHTVAAATAGRPDVRTGAQNVYWEPKGAFTGEMSVGIAADAGARAVLVGHSERRHVFGESDEETRRKTAAALGSGLDVMLCVGEKLEEREAGRTEDVVRRQLDAVVPGLSPEAMRSLVIAYEPVWAIGTGRNATPSDAASVHRLIRRHLEPLAGARRMAVLYGGSVSAANAAALLAEPDIDGVLVGGASLDPDGWAGIVETGRQTG